MPLPLLPLPFPFCRYYCSVGRSRSEEEGRQNQQWHSIVGQLMGIISSSSGQMLSFPKIELLVHLLVCSRIDGRRRLTAAVVAILCSSTTSQCDCFPSVLPSYTATDAAVSGGSARRCAPHQCAPLADSGGFGGIPPAL